MGQKDKTERILESYNDVFADIVNGCLFDGQQVALPGEFTDATIWGYYKVTGRVRDQERDIAKYWHRGNICISLIGMENQTKPDPYMPIRIMSYDAAEYRNQLVKKGVSPLHPVISIVLYLNHTTRWNQPLTLKGCLDIPPDIDPYIHDYGINLFEIGWMTLDEVDQRFHGDFRIVAEFFVQKRLNSSYRPRPQIMHHSREVIQLISAMAGDHRYEDAYNEIMSEGKRGQKGVTMCTVYDQIENQGIEKGRLEGYRSAQADDARGMLAEGISLEQIARILHTDANTVQEMLQQA